MTRLTRRGLLRQTTLGTAAAGALLLASGPAFAQTTNTLDGTSVSRTAPDRALNDSHEPLGAYVHDVASGELTLLVGARELTIRDPELVRRLVQAAR